MHPTRLKGGTTPFPSPGYVRPNPTKRTQHPRRGPLNRTREVERRMRQDERQFVNALVEAWFPVPTDGAR